MSEQPEPTEPAHPQPATPLPPPKKRAMGELGRRLLTAAVLVPAVVGVIVLGGLPYLFTVILFILLAQREFYGLIEDKGAQPHVALGLGASVVVALLVYRGSEYDAMLLMTVLLLVLMVAQLRKQVIADALSSISGTFFGVFYVGWLLSHAILLRRFDSVMTSRYGADSVSGMGLVPDAGIFLVIFTLTIVVWCDAGAYFAGGAYGRHPLAPRISPSKTLEGALGGLLGGVAAALVVKAMFDIFWPTLSEALPWRWVVPFALILSIVGIIGDLVESLLKRDAEVKDAGRLLPGMGGVLDRIDAPLLALPVMYYMLLAYFYLSFR